LVIRHIEEKFNSSKMVQGQIKPVYKAATFSTKDEASYKKSQFDFKGQERKEVPKMKAAEKKPDPWGKTFKNEQHFKSLHIC